MNVYYVATYVLRFIVLNFKIKPIHKLKNIKNHSLSRQLRPIFEEILPSLNRIYGYFF